MTTPTEMRTADATNVIPSTHSSEISLTAGISTNANWLSHNVSYDLVQHSLAGTV